MRSAASLFPKFFLPPPPSLSLPISLYPSSHTSPASIPGTLSSSTICLVPLVFLVGELHSTSWPLMDGEWSKGCESALSVHSRPSRLAILPFLSSTTHDKKEIDASVSPRKDTLVSVHTSVVPFTMPPWWNHRPDHAPAHSIRDVN